MQSHAHSSAVRPITVATAIRRFRKGGATSASASASASACLGACVGPTSAWRAGAVTLLRVSADERAALSVELDDPSGTVEEKMLVLDLLAAAGTSEAQAIMCRWLARADVRSDVRAFAILVQRLGFIDVPDAETLRFLATLYTACAASSPDARPAVAYALGTAAGRDLNRASVEATKVLRADLARATDPGLQRALLSGLGNAGVPEDALLVLRFAGSSDPGVRGAAALAMRKLTGEKTRRCLIEMLADREASVAESALGALGEQMLAREEIERLAELVVSGHTRVAMDARVLHLMVAQRFAFGESASALVVEEAIRLLVGRLDPSPASVRKSPAAITVNARPLPRAC